MSGAEELVYRAFRLAHYASAKWTTNPNVVYVTEVVQCLRKSYFERLYPDKIPDDQIAVMMIGEAIHEILNAHFPIGAGEQEYAKKHGDIEIHGRVDRILGDTIVEFKTTADLPKKNLGARLRHIDQLQLYFWLTGLSKGMLVYISRLTGRVAAFAVHRDEDRINTLLERATIYAKHLREGTVPDAEEGPLCKYCPFRQDCLKLQARASQEQQEA